jgi:uncharacterized protein (TIGR00290 family)
MSMTVAVSWSGGKESCLACYRAMKDGFEISHLLNFISKDGRCMSHGLEREAIDFQSKAIEIPLVQWRTSWKNYAWEFRRALRRMKEVGVEGVIFGDISEIPGHEGWIDDVCSKSNITPIKPLWGHASMQVLRDFIDSGFEAIVVVTDAEVLGKEWVGRRVDRRFANDIGNLECEVDPCGELGEYHTYVTYGPLFKNRICILESRKILRDGHWYLDINQYEVT